MTRHTTRPTLAAARDLLAEQYQVKSMEPGQLRWLLRRYRRVLMALAADCWAEGTGDDGPGGHELNGCGKHPGLTCTEHIAREHFFGEDGI
jgi:hypothetical protein